MDLERVRNRILRAFARSSPDSYARFVGQLEPRALARGTVIGAPRTHGDSAYFVETGVVSLVASTRGGRSLEVAIVGDEGVAGIADALGQYPLPYSWVVQLTGLAYRVPTSTLREHIHSCTALHGLLMDYSQQMMHQLAQSAMCNRFHTSTQRLARWLLLTAERAGTTRLELTHEYVAQMVGVPRSAVSAAAATLRDESIIEYQRGVVTIRSADRLRRKACECLTVISQATQTISQATP